MRKRKGRLEPSGGPALPPPRRRVLAVLGAQQVEGDGDAGVGCERDELGREEGEAVDLERGGQRRGAQQAHRLDGVFAQLAKQVAVPGYGNAKAVACAHGGAAALMEI